MNKKIISWGLFGVIVLMFVIRIFFNYELFYERTERGSWSRNRNNYLFEFVYNSTTFILVLSIFFINFKLFFFGFLAKKWKRLIRTILIIVVISLITINENGGYGKLREEEIAFLFFFFCIPSISLISWVIKPFVVKEDS